MTNDAPHAPPEHQVTHPGAPSSPQDAQPEVARAEDDREELTIVVSQQMLMGLQDRNGTNDARRKQATCMSKNDDVSVRRRGEGKPAGHDGKCVVLAHHRTVARATQVARVTRLRHADTTARHAKEIWACTDREGADGLVTVSVRRASIITVHWTMRQRRAPHGGHRAQLGDPRVNVPNRDSPLSPPPIRTPSTPSNDGQGLGTQFVTLPRTLQENLWDGPARKRKRESSRSRSHSAKRGRWEDSLDSETYDWVEEMRLQVTNLLMDNSAKTNKIETLEEKVAYLQRALAETRWELAEKTGQTGGKNRYDFVEDEIDLMKNPPPAPERVDDGLEDVYSEVDSDTERRQAKARRKKKQKEINAKDRAAAANAPPIAYPTAPTFDSPVDSWAVLDDNDDGFAAAQSTRAASPRGHGVHRLSPTPSSSNSRANLRSVRGRRPYESSDKRPDVGLHADGGQRGHKSTQQQEQQKKPAKKRKPTKAAQSLREVHVEGTITQQQQQLRLELEKEHAGKKGSNMAVQSTMDDGEFPRPIACPGTLMNGLTCGGKTDWGRVDRMKGQEKKTFIIAQRAQCPTHRIVARMEGKVLARLYYWATTPGQRRTMPKSKHPHGDPCTHCDGGASAECDHWLCAPCCRKVGPYCKLHAHTGDTANGKVVIKNVSSILWRPKIKLPVTNVDGREIIDVDAIPDPPQKMINIEVNCEHRWKIGRHVLLTAAEVYREEGKEWKTLRAIKVLVEAVHYPEGYCKGREISVKHDCYLRRRHWEAADCKFTLNDINESVLEKLGLDNADFASMDDGRRRKHGIDEDTLLQAQPLESRFNDHELHLVVRVHGSDFNPLKRDGHIGYAEGWELSEEEMVAELNHAKRRKTDSHVVHD
ncbi:hypothetical protein AURDEDRAFT_126175 [Auricularia subglabra TFB-10046 SS5]|nr:hypothetical protein AURDEDRAFT_126175 [Auricularia subglabra TFB-10046 SS5]